MKFYYILLALLIPVALLFSGCVTQEQQETIKIGFVGPLSGDMSVYGISSKGGMQLAADDMNWTINGKKIEFVYEDGKCDAKASTEAFSKLINVDGVKYILGPVCSSELLAGASLAENAKVINIGSATTSPKLHEAGVYSFAMYPLDDSEGKFNAEFIVSKLGKKNVAMLTCLSDWCKGYEEPMKKTIEALGGKLLILEHNEKGAKDLKTQLTKIKETNPDVLFAVEYPEEFANLVPQAKELGLNTTFYIPQMITEDTLRTMGSDVEGFYTVKADVVLKDQNAFLERLKQKTDLPTPEIDLTAGRSYDALFMLKNAIEKADSFDTEVIKDTLLTIKYDGITGHHEFDKDGTPATSNYKVLRVVNGQFVQQN